MIAGLVSGLAIDVERRGAALCVRLSGVLDASAAPRVRAQLKPALKDGASLLVFDLEGVSYVDRSGIDALVHAARVAGRLGARVILVRCPEDARRQLAALGRDNLFEYR